MFQPRRPSDPELLETTLPTSSDSPSVSFVIPAHNAEDTIEASVQSALDQSRPPQEVIVVVDGSTDSTGDRVRAFGGSVRAVQTSHVGLGRARILGHEVATGDVVAWLDADDTSLARRIELQVETLRSLPDVVLISSDFRSVRDGRIEPGLGVREYYVQAERLEAIYGRRAQLDRGTTVLWGGVGEELLYGNFVHPPTVMVRRTAFLEAAPEPKNLSVAEDWLTFLALAQAGPFAFIDEALVDYRRSDDQMSSPRHSLQQALDVFAATESIAREHPELVARSAPRWRQTLASRHEAVALAAAEASRSAALRHLLHSIRLRGLGRRHIRLLGRTLAPRWLLRGIRTLQ